ncbi:MAG TPA: 16S rRNA (adenine(1518)-N(6)/adenine(1519)-N(6))-dimethyltransferase RsmA [Myxococcales bacterium]|nr:16S rRNA (adenine(1518)-N(6)/adenine(1519)-N(6))-dimethyltransferase RsmA [Myxococcales bacterium]
MNPGELLRRHGLRPKKEWGQNFLGDERLLSALASLARLGPGQVVVELGAGLGHFTRALAATGARVVAVERDRELAPILRAELPGVEVIEADAKSFDLLAVAERAGQRVVVCGNLPYHLSSPILFHLLDQRAAVRRAVLLLQREVAERIAAPPGGREYGLLSVLLQQVADPSLALAVPRHAFTPPPEVESTALVLEFLDQPRAAIRDEARFRTLIKAAFSQRRKTLWNALKAMPGARQALEGSGIDPQRRAETLTVEEFARIERGFPEALFL